MVRKAFCAVAGIFLTAAAMLAQGIAQTPAPAGDSWRFVVSGDSRNCGDVVMPEIAAGALRDGAQFYWHLGDFRAIYTVDEDIQHQPEHVGKTLSLSAYQNLAWQDFIDNQIAPFGKLPIFLAVGNHEIIPPKSRGELLPQFADWFNSPAIATQRLRDDPRDHLMKTYYHWIEHGVSFYTMDNITSEQFDAAQLRWFESVLARDAKDPSVLTVVVGAHEALSDSIALSSSMDEPPMGIVSGRRVYADLLRFQNQTNKHVYFLASHAHYYMDNIFNTEYLRTHGGVLPGWIVGTAGAVRYPLPPRAADAKAAETNVYGYMLATVAPSGEISFDFKRLNESDVSAAVVNRYKPDFVHWCFAENTQAR